MILRNGYDLLERKQVKSWLKSVSAFTNGVGGTLIFGITNDNEMVGLEDAESDAEFISEIIKAKLVYKGDRKIFN